MAKGHTWFEQIPMAVAKSAARENTKETRVSHIMVCAICCQSVDLKHCKTDENGNAVHEECYVQKITPGKLSLGKFRRND
jgi:thiamine biosynthesis protein ThiC